MSTLGKILKVLVLIPVLAVLGLGELCRDIGSAVLEVWHT